MAEMFFYGPIKAEGWMLGEWVYRSRTEQYVEEPQPDDLIESITPGAAQKNWRTPSEFPLCPSEIDANGLDEYLERLKNKEVFSRNTFGESIVVSAELSESSETLVVLSKHPGGVKDWALARVAGKFSPTFEGYHHMRHQHRYEKR
ncbi:MAG: hypothetical protein PVI00_17910 [Desulfobacterales bacterium]|jgi:hypothetical protein